MAPGHFWMSNTWAVSENRNQGYNITTTIRSFSSTFLMFQLWQQSASQMESVKSCQMYYIQNLKLIYPWLSLKHTVFCIIVYRVNRLPDRDLAALGSLHLCILSCVLCYSFSLLATTLKSFPSCCTQPLLFHLTPFNSAPLLHLPFTVWCPKLFSAKC